jgi:glycosyltransferase involved in cell wall biosynthesis
MMLPRFSLVVPVFNVEQYLPRFLISLDAQTFERTCTEIILVDDGSPDDSGALLDDWAAHRPGVRVIHQVNGGLSAARNSGLEEATGEWILFPDPDDELPREYLATLDTFVTEHQDEAFDVIAVSRIVRDERTGRIKNKHPLRGIFRHGDRVVTLDHASPEFQLAVNSGAVRHAALEATGLRFDGRVRPTFEDGHLIGKLLLERGTGLGICTGTEYLWTRRMSGDSVTQSSWGRPERYDDVFRFGYLDLLRTAVDRLGRVPNWTARMVLYDLHWYLRMDRKVDSPFLRLDRAARELLVDHFGSVMDLIACEHIAGFDLCPDDEILAGLLSFKELAFFRAPARSRMLLNRVGRVEYLYRGPRPTESIVVNGEPVAVTGAEEPIRFFGQVRLIRRRLEFPVARAARATPEVQLLLDDAPVPVLSTDADESVRPAFTSQALRWLSSRVRLAPAPGQL